MEVIYYTKREYIPENDPHWTVISIANLDKFLDKANQMVSIRTKICDQTGMEKSDGDEKQELL